MRFLKNIIIILVSLSFGKLYCQEKPETILSNSQWINVGFGGSDGISSLDLGLYYNYKGKRILNIRYLYNETSLKYFDRNRITDFYDLGILHGWNYRKNMFAVSASGGLSLLLIRTKKADLNSQYTRFNEKNNYYPSIPLEFKIMFIPLKYLSIGGSINSNINSVKSYNTYMVEIGLGIFRQRTIDNE